MRTEGTTFQIAVVVGAILLGVLLDRLLLAGSSASHERAGSATVAEEASGTSGDVASAEPWRSSSDSSRRTSEAAPAARGSGAGKALDSILEQNEPRQRLQELQAFINSLSPAEYPDALKRVRRITNSNERELASRLLVANWAHADPDGALQFAAGNRGYEYLAQDVFQQMAANDFDGAMARAEGIPGTELRYRALRGVLSHRADSDPAAAVALAQKMGAGMRGREPLANAIYRQWATTDPQAAAMHAAQGTQGSGWRSGVAPVVQTWAEQDPAAAANWAVTVDDGRVKSDAIAQVMRSWSRDDANAAANWIHGLGEGASRDAAVAGLAQSLVARDPQTALGWIGSISDEATRTRTLQRISSAVMWREPEKGAEMLQAAGLPAEQIRDYRRRRER